MVISSGFASQPKSKSSPTTSLSKRTRIRSKTAQLEGLSHLQTWPGFSRSLARAKGKSAAEGDQKAKMIDSNIFLISYSQPEQVSALSNTVQGGDCKLSLANLGNQQNDFAGWWKRVHQSPQNELCLKEPRSYLYQGTGERQTTTNRIGRETVVRTAMKIRSRERCDIFKEGVGWVDEGGSFADLLKAAVHHFLRSGSL